eukprot:CAMPEP_0171460812 /NCGR_PEP_ID=MMETSP0945-20130129/5534_1 /TAXON_ID=109269 /ORGANISM="Vaucheria litorea, Strain CCMP2940" /LENGTH=281 /DNA_ID=CAMNT_0011987081 /DNA_START=1036 /DNA_END=1881 /DNA_ORIENTATION=-
MRRMPPNDIRNNLAGLVNLVPDCLDELLQRVDQPLQEAKDSKTGRQYILCEYNRDADSYRSPWSNEYDPPLEDAYLLSDELRKLEEDANELFDAYRELYFKGGTSSVYLWDLEENEGFAGAFLIKKDTDGSSWESIHIVEVDLLEGEKKASYKLNTTIMLSLKPNNSAAGDTILCGSVSSASERTFPYTSLQSHLPNIGKMIEKMETELRNNIDGVYIQKTHQVLSGMRRSVGMAPVQGAAFTMQLNKAIGFQGGKRDQGIYDELAKISINKGKKSSTDES